MKLRQLWWWIRQGRRERSCEACGAEFACTLSLNGCWCGDVKLTDAARAAMRKKYSDCLCPACLAAVTAGAAREAAR